MRNKFQSTATSRSEDVAEKQYYRTENEIEGSGVGLYLVKQIVENSDGKVIVESAKGKGSEFRVYLKQD